MAKSALQKHREALLERAVRLQQERDERIAARKARHQAELNATGRIVTEVSPLAEMVKELRKDELPKGWLKWW